MRILTNKVLLTLLTIGFFSASAQNGRINVVTSAVPFLRISPDARSGGMGDAGLATSPDASSIFWNLAKVPFSKSKASVALTYTPWLRDLKVNDVFLGSLSGYYQLGDDQAISGSLRYFNLGKIQFTDFLGNDLFVGQPREYSFDVGYSRKLSSKIGVGLAVRYIHSNLTGNLSTSGVTYKAGNSIAADLSFFYNGVKESGEGWRFGAAMTNLGSKISYTNDARNKDYIPANLGIGASYTWRLDETNTLTLALDANKLLVPTPPTDTSNGALNNYRNKSVLSSWFSSFGDSDNEFKEITFSGGLEYWYNDQFALRAGYFYEDKDKGNRKYFTAGAGLKYNVFSLNLSYLVPSGSGTTRNPLSNTLRFSLIFDLDNESTTK